MKRGTNLLILVAAVLGLMASLTAPADAQALLMRTWVSGVGSDGNPCTRTAPCLTFAGAYGKTAASGEINCLDPGGFGTLTITQSITISCETGTAGIFVAGSGNGITVSAAATDTVYLRGLDIERGSALGNDLPWGIFIANDGGTVHIEKCLIRGLQWGIVYEPTGASSLFVADTVVADNGNATAGGNIQLLPLAAGVVANVSLERVQMTGGSVGVRADGTLANPLRVSITDSLASGNLYNGFFAKTTSGKVTMMVDHSTASNNGASGARADGALAKLVLSRSVVSGNVTGVSTINGGALLSYQDNRIDLNGTDGWPITSLALH